MRPEDLIPGGKMTPLQIQQTVHRTLKGAPQLRLLRVHCQTCGRSLDSWICRLWHRIVCRKQGGHW